MRTYLSERCETRREGGTTHPASHEYLGDVFVQCALRVSQIGHIPDITCVPLSKTPIRPYTLMMWWVSLDHNAVIRSLALLVQDPIRGDHVLHHPALGDLFGAELLRSGQIETVVVAQVVVGGYGHRLDTRGHQQIHQTGFKLGLACDQGSTCTTSITSILKKHITEQWSPDLKSSPATATPSRSASSNTPYNREKNGLSLTRKGVHVSRPSPVQTCSEGSH